MAFDLYANKVSPGCGAVLVTAKHLGIDVNFKELDLMKGEHMSDEFIKINPYHTVPTLVDGNFILWQSRAIMQYLCNKYGPDSSLYPRDPQQRAMVDLVLDIDMGYFDAIHEVLAMIFQGKEVPEKDLENYHKSLKMLDTFIEDKKFLAGDKLTLADLSVAHTTVMMAFNEFKDLGDYKNLLTWYNGIRQESDELKESIEGIRQLFDKLMAEKLNSSTE